MSLISTNSNIPSLKAQRSRGQAEMRVARSLERLSTGVRINRASDDAAGLSLSSLLDVKRRVYAQAVRNLNEGVSLVNVAGGALEELTNIVTRISELATRAANATLSDSERAPLDAEAQALAQEYERIRETTDFGDLSLLQDPIEVEIQAGYGEKGAISVELGNSVEEAAEELVLEDIFRASVASGGGQGNSLSFIPSISADGRYVAFRSNSSNLVAGDTNSVTDIFVHDSQTGTTERVSVDSGGAQANGASFNLSISADGRYVTFRSSASNLVAGDTNGVDDIFVHDTQTGTTTRVSVDSVGAEANSISFNPSISADGRYVAFQSDATNLVAADTNGVGDIFVHDRQTGQTTRVSVDSGGTEGNANSVAASISADSRYVSFHSNASNLVVGDTNGSQDVFVHDRQTGQTTRVSVDSGGTEGNAGSATSSISADGRYVAFFSSASNLVAGDTNGANDIFVHDRQTGQTTRVSVDSAGVQGNSLSIDSSISADGRYVAFRSNSSNLVAGDTNAASDVFVHDRQTGQTTRVSVDSAGAQGNGNSTTPSISADGKYVAFESAATNLVAGDTNGVEDAFVAPNSIYEPNSSSSNILALPDFDLLTMSTAQQAMDLMEQQREAVARERARAAGSQSRLSFATNLSTSLSETYETARSRIMDIDVAQETATLLRNGILRDGAAAVLAQANQQPAIVLDLLGAPRLGPARRRR